jgi:mannose-6-phosphate isomerase
MRRVIFISGHLKSEKFPLLTKIIDANNDLSVRVQPDDTFAIEHEVGKMNKR